MEPRWLNDTQQQAWRSYIESSRLLIEALDRQLQQVAEMPHAYYEILMRLSEAPAHTLRMSELAELTLCSRSRLSHAVARLEERDWVVRENCPTDRRGQNARLTPAGWEVLREVAPLHVESVRHLVIDAIDADQLQQLATISSVIAERARQATAAPSTSSS